MATSSDLPRFESRVFFERHIRHTLAYCEADGFDPNGADIDGGEIRVRAVLAIARSTAEGRRVRLARVSGRR